MHLYAHWICRIDAISSFLKANLHLARNILPTLGLTILRLLVERSTLDKAAGWPSRHRCVSSRRSTRLQACWYRVLHWIMSKRSSTDLYASIDPNRMTEGYAARPSIRPWPSAPHMSKVVERPTAPDSPIKGQTRSLGAGSSNLFRPRAACSSKLRHASLWRLPAPS